MQKQIYQRWSICHFFVKLFMTNEAREHSAMGGGRKTNGAERGLYSTGTCGRLRVKLALVSDENGGRRRNTAKEILSAWNLGLGTGARSLPQVLWLQHRYLRQAGREAGTSQQRRRRKKTENCKGRWRKLANKHAKPYLLPPLTVWTTEGGGNTWNRLLSMITSWKPFCANTQRVPHPGWVWPAKSR